MNGPVDELPAELDLLVVQLCHQLNMVAELPEWIAHGDLPKHPRHAAIESFLMNVRSIQAFLSGNGYPDDFLPAQLFSGAAWDPGPTAERWQVPLAEAKTFADKHVAHISRTERVSDPFPTLTYDTMSRYRTATQEGIEHLAAGLRSAGQTPAADTLTAHLMTARSRAVWPVPPWP